MIFMKSVRLIAVMLLFYFVCLPCINEVFGQVNSQTGSAVFNVPIYNYQDHKSRLSLPVSLGYSSGFGFKVDEVASEVGQGWGLSAGGKITRIQVGEPDDQLGRTATSTFDLLAYPNGYLYTNQNPQNGAPIHYGRYPVFKEQNRLYKGHNNFLADRELDYFSLTVNGISAIFVLKKAAIAPGSTGEGVFLGNTLMKVRFEVSATNTQSLPSPIVGSTRTTISAFIVTDANGIEYRFETKAYQKVMKLAPSDRNFKHIQKAPKKYKKRQVYHVSYFDDDFPKPENPYIVNEWNLTSISDLMLPSRKIEFSYDYRELTYWLGVDFSIVKSKKEYAMLTGKRTKNVIPVLKKITCPKNQFTNTEEYTIEFKYGAERFDIEGSKKLESITVKYKGAVLQKHVLDQSYIIYTRYGTPNTELQKKASRLYLLGIKKYSPNLKDEERPLKFDYYTGGSDKNDFVPPPFYYAKDIWGYFNGFIASEVYPANRSAARKLWDKVFDKKADEYPGFDDIKRICYKDSGITAVKNGYAKNGLLKSVEYPEGGQLVYEYEQNKAAFYNETAEQDVGGVHVSKTILYDGGYNTNCNLGGGLETTYKYQMADGKSSMWGMERPLNYNSVLSDYKPFEKIYKPVLPFPTPVKCDYRFKYPGISQSEYASDISGFQDIVANPVFQTASMALDIYNKVKYVKAISHALKTTGPLAGWLSIAIDALMNIVEFVYTCFVQDDVSGSTVETWYNYDLKQANPLPVQYKRVEVYERNGENGKVVNEFTSDANYAIWVPVNPIYNKRQRYAPWAYGLPLKTTVFSASGKKVKEVINTYNLNDTCSNTGGGTASIMYLMPFALGVQCINKQAIGAFSCNTYIKKSIPEKSTTWLASTYTSLASSQDFTTTSTDEIGVTIYNLYTGRTELLSTEERVFDQLDDNKYLKNVISYLEYDANNYEPKSIHKLSADGTETFESIAYNNQYTMPNPTTDHVAAMNKLVELGIINIPVFKSVAVKRHGALSMQGYIKEETTEFKIVAGTSSMVKPSVMFEKRVAAPDLNIAAALPTAVARYYYKSGTGIVDYVEDEGQRRVFNLYDYDDQLKVATVINASAGDQLLYTSFETHNHNGWNLTGATPDATGSTITGSNRLVLAPGVQISKTFSPITAKPYTLSFWAGGGTVNIVIGGQTLPAPKIGPIRNGYTYYEYNLLPGATSISISGNALVDELRFYPKAARMETTTYDPLIGKTSSCDAGNRFVSYTYDNRARLTQIKDENGAIVKMYEYNVKAKHTPCPTSYSSNAVYELAQRDSCAANSVGGFVEYYIPAGAYTSNISQQHADMLAEQALMANLQAYAYANAGCITVYYNVLKSATFQKQCDVGLVGSSVTYTVLAGKYSSTISQEDADDQADEDLDANGQWFADENGTCIVNTQPVWEADDANLRCRTVNGATTGQTEALFTDINPNSSTYNQVRWELLEVNVLGCTVQTGGYCTLTAFSPIYFPTYSIYCNGSQTTGYLVVWFPNGITMGSTVTIGAFSSGSCKPTVNRSQSVQSGGRTYMVSYNSSGTISVTLIGGGSLPAQSSISINSINYNL
jgi:hypothetical protein